MGTYQRCSASLFVLLVGAGCAPEYDWVVIDDANSDGAATLVEEAAEAGLRRETFQLGTDTRTAVADYLFVIDSSVSMREVLDRFHSGIASLVEDSPFPAKARIGVMTTLPGDPSDLSRLHPTVRGEDDLLAEPGFLSLVDRESIAEYRERAPKKVARRYRYRGCESGWFKPGDTNAGGVPCLTAHTQIGLRPVIAEAGLTALQQLLADHGDEPIFRAGAAVNVIFISDTHSPGLDRPAAWRRSGLEVDPILFDDLRTLVDDSGPVASLRIHAIAPETECSERWAHLGPRYFDVARASGGEILDVCTATDYTDFVRRVADQGARLQEPVIPLGRPAAGITAVRIDGSPVDYTVSGDGRVLTLGLAAMPEQAVVEVSYRPAD